MIWINENEIEKWWSLDRHFFLYVEYENDLEKV